MGALCCCCAGDEDGEDQKETEMKATISEADKKTLAISPKMSAPTINVKDRTYVSGHGLAIAAVPIEQDAAYWEWHIAVLTTLGLDVHLVEDIMFGVASKKDRKFYQELEENGAEKTDSDIGTDLMRKIEVQDGDVVGVAVQQSDLPMVQFLLNGDVLHESAINRFRGTVYPSLYLPNATTSESVKVNLVLDEAKFQQMSPGPRFGPVIVARSIC